ncbi:glycosyltransferase family 2 protein [Polynucleobacter sp. HIN8]|uniref:glycosyltransferase family 2 protein n=1 Tax=Polynucleobacter sp. HIN8 TaxID=3047867 RepID=UPI0025746F4B|nr:glycosyltransferase family 2 protein [Polynucleobacter sp. HIN8]
MSLSAKSKLKISIITICYNSAKTIERTIQSVISQTYPAIEYIIIDGKSSDKTLNIIDKYSSHISQLISESDDGIYDAMNKGLQIATGDILCFLNSDDIYESNKTIERVVKRFHENQIDALFGGVSFFHKSNPSKVSRVYKFDNFNLRKFSFGWMPAHPATFIKKKLIRQNGLFDTSFQVAGDFDYLLRMFKKLEFNYECSKDILVRMQMGGVSNQNLAAKIILNKEILFSCNKNDVETNLLKILSRYPFKLLEYLI